MVIDVTEIGCHLRVVFTRNSGITLSDRRNGSKALKQAVQDPYQASNPTKPVAILADRLNPQD